MPQLRSVPVVWVDEAAAGSTVAVAGDGVEPVVGVVLACTGVVAVCAGDCVADADGAADGMAAGVAAGAAVDGEPGTGVDGADGAEIAGVALEDGAARDWDVSFPPPQAVRLMKAKRVTSVWRFN
jgi:hypothetical protein